MLSFYLWKIYKKFSIFEKLKIEEMNKDLILREKLAIQRTILANQSTFLSFLRTSMYFLMAGLTLQNIFNDSKYFIFEIILFAISVLVLVSGIINYFRNAKLIKQSEIHIGNFKIDYISDNT